MEKIVTFTPIPIASVTTATIENPGFLSSTRSEYFTSFRENMRALSSKICCPLVLSRPAVAKPSACQRPIGQVTLGMATRYRG